jgi:hypothetical protein
MEKTTVLARLHLAVDFDQAGRRWLQRYPDAWFCREDGSLFLAEFGHTWESLFVESAQAEVAEYFTQLGLPSEHLPFVQPGERYRGSWVLDAAIVMAGTVGTAYAVLKGVSDLPDIADGLTKLKKRIGDRFKPRINDAVRDQLLQTAASSQSNSLELQTPPRPPVHLIAVDLVIDARPVLSLTPALLKAHRVHLSIGVSRDSFSLENLGDEAMRNMKLGLFRTETERHQWAYQDAYTGDVPLLSPKQTVTKRLGEFRDRRGNLLDMSDGAAAYVDCWVEDSHGIYLFRFFLESE